MIARHVSILRGACSPTTCLIGNLACRIFNFFAVVRVNGDLKLIIVIYRIVLLTAFRGYKMYNYKINTGFVSPEMPKARADINRFRSKKDSTENICTNFSPFLGEITRGVGGGGNIFFLLGKKLILCRNTPLYELQICIFYTNA